MTNDANDYCDGCKHLKYEEPSGFFCYLNKEPKPHPDEPEHLYCESRGEEE